MSTGLFPHQLSGVEGAPWGGQVIARLVVLLDSTLDPFGTHPRKGLFPPALTRSVLQGPPLNSHFRNGRNEGAVPVTFTNEVYNLVSDFLDGVPIIPYVFSRLEQTRKGQSAGLGNTPQ